MKKIKENRLASFILMLVIYIIATLGGILTYKVLPFDSFYINLLLADVVATIIVFIFSLILNNASVYDPYWSVQPIVIVGIYLIFTPITSFVQLIPFIAICLWGIRLTLNWAYTFKGLMYQDWRYTMLKETTKKFYPLINFIGIHMVPTLVVYACTLPAVVVLKYANKFNIGVIIFFIVSICSAILQCIADIQMHKYRKIRTTPFIRTGVWKYSRHPNYLGEILMWWGVGLICVVVLPGYWYLLLGAILNTLLFLFVSIPMADKRQSKKEGFNEYKKATRMLLPIKK